MLSFTYLFGKTVILSYYSKSAVFINVQKSMMENVTTNNGNIPNTQCTLQGKGTMVDNKLTNKGEHFLNPQERADKGKTLKQLIAATLQNERKRYQTLSFTSIEFCASFILATVV